MYENGLVETKPQKERAISGAQRLDVNPTVGENIDNKIAMLRAEIERLEKSKEALAPLMPMRIRDIRDAMNY